VIKPTPVAAALSQAYGGTCLPQRETPVLWPTCATCRGEKRMTVCRTCGGFGKIPVFAP
jgi:hypothetical protein